ncbi:hypothetical protein CDAR_268761 [Caerostris darwini]|uniref:Uncharacterized protein n=1 Tax=Caerostris darwini TaxID=1538125 RepID=A0AAV4R3V0_9ARAC|nr:hypothetical protein CDAR_268761 [Caerostris darwini]
MSMDEQKGKSQTVPRKSGDPQNLGVLVTSNSDGTMAAQITLHSVVKAKLAQALGDAVIKPGRVHPGSNHRLEPYFIHPELHLPTSQHRFLGLATLSPYQSNADRLQ